MAGLGEVCSHVGAILFYTEATHHVKTCTELPCGWNMPTSIDSIPYARIANIDFTRPKPVILPGKRGAHCHNDCAMETDPANIEVAGDSAHFSSTSRVGSLNPNLIPTNESEAASFFNNTVKHTPAVLSLIPPYCDLYVPYESDKSVLFDIPGLNSLYKAENEELMYKELLEVGEGVVFELCAEQIYEIDQHTRAQQGCDLWFKHRAGHITASKMKAACHSDPATPLLSLIKQICYLKLCSFSTPATRWGCEHEDVACQLYIAELEQQHTDFECCHAGLTISEELPYIAATPDGFTNCACHGEGVLEVKCPYCTKDLGPNFAKFLDNGTLPPSHQYFYQVQTQMMVCQREFADFVVCTFPDDVPTITVQGILIDEDFLVSCVKKSGDFYKVAILPKLLGRWFT